MPNRLQPKLAIACAKGGGSLLNWMNFSSLPANFEERKIVGLSKPYNFGVGRDGAVQTGSPVMCEEETIENSSNLLSVPVLGIYDHEDANTKEHLNSKRSVVHHQSIGEKPKKKHRKRNKKKGKRQFGYQRGKDNQKSSQSQRPSESEQPVPKQVNNVVGNTHQRINQPNKNGHGEDSDSEEENKGRQDYCGGHYAGVPNDERMTSAEEGCDEEDEDEVEICGAEGVSGEREEASMSVDSGPPPWQDPKCVAEGMARIVNAMEMEVDGPILALAKKIKSTLIHVSYKNCEANCRVPLCRQVRGFLEHAKMRHGECKICNMVDLGSLLHAVECSQFDCPVSYCGYWKNWLEARHDRRRVKGHVIHSTTTLFRENTVLYEDNDYTFLEKAKLGRGSFGTVSRVWFYSPVHQLEADIVLKEAKYVLEEEAKIHQTIRQNHPNLLGAMAIIKLDTPRSVCDSQKPIHGYILMERGDCTLYDLKMKYRSRGERGLPHRDAFFYLYQVLEGLRYLHEKKIVHKDVKDLNVLLFNGGQLAKLSDWDGSIFVRNEAELTRTSSIERKGTPGFCAMEVYSHSCHAFPADIYSAGAMLLEILYGGIYTRPHDTPKQQEERKQDAISTLKTKHLELGNLIERCMSNVASERPTAYELVNSELLKFEQGFKTDEVGTQAQGDQQLALQEFRYLADIDGEGGDAVRERFNEIKDKPPEDVLRMMDTLDKVLPSENLPQSSTWEGIIAQASQDETDSEEVMDTS